MVLIHVLVTNNFQISGAWFFFFFGISIVLVNLWL